MTDIKVVEMELYHLLYMVNRQDMESKFIEKKLPSRGLAAYHELLLKLMNEDHANYIFDLDNK